MPIPTITPYPSRLLLNLNLGGRVGTSMALGSLLDDNLFHEVVISRERRDIILSVDRVRARDRIKGDFHKLNLGRRTEAIPLRRC